MPAQEGIRYGICRVSICPMRSKAKDKAEMVSQLLYGELVEIFNKKGSNWIQVISAHDEYLGWVDTKQILVIDQKSFNALKECKVFALDWITPASDGKKTIPICAGANLHNFDGLTFKSPMGRFQYSGQIIEPSKLEITPELIVKLASQYLNVPYLWGGRSPFGIDCSGYTQVLFKMLGYELPRDSSQQALHGEVIDFIEEAQTGDLAFFVNADNRVIHVGLLIGNDKVIHASGWVRIDKIDHFGIYNEDQKKYSHVLRVIKRILPVPS